MLSRLLSWYKYDIVRFLSCIAYSVLINIKTITFCYIYSLLYIQLYLQLYGFILSRYQHNIDRFAPYVVSCNNSIATNPNQ